MKITKTKLKQIIKEEVETFLSEGQEELKAIADKIRNMPTDPQLQKAFKAKYARHANKAMGKDIDDQWGTGWVEAVMFGGF